MLAKMPLEEAKARSLDLMVKGFHCGPSVLQVMWEKYELENEDFLWTSIPFLGGISGQQQAPCGAVTAGSIALGLRHKCSISDNEKAHAARKTIRDCAGELVKSFNETFGGITCMEVVGIDFSKPGAYKEFLASGVWKDRCVKYVEFVIEKLYEFEDRQCVG